MSLPISVAVRTAYNLTAVSAVVATHLVRINTRALVAVPGDLWHGRCLRNAKRCLHPRPTGADADQLNDPVCCQEVAQIMGKLPTTSTSAA